MNGWIVEERNGWIKSLMVGWMSSWVNYITIYTLMARRNAGWLDRQKKDGYIDDWLKVWTEKLLAG